jgi:hypothetical protein
MAGRLKSAGVLILCLWIGLQAGCAGPGAVPSSPSWHQLDSGCYDTGEGRFFYGIGRAGGAQNLTLLRAAADNRSRKELESVLEQYILELARIGAGNQDRGWALLAAGERRQILAIVVREAMQRAVISDHWSDSRQGGMISLCRLSLSDFKTALSGSGALDDPVRSAMISGAERLHARLARKL